VKDLQYYGELVSLLEPALVTGAAVAASSGVTGVFVVLRRESLLALALPQVVAVGLAIGLNRGWAPFYPAVAVVAAAVLIVTLSRIKQRADAILPALYVAGLSFSILLIAHSGAHLAELQNLFTGIDVSVTVGEAWRGTPVLLAAGIVVAIFWRRWLLIAQAPGTAAIAGVPVRLWHTLFLSLLAVTVLVGTNAMGITLVVAMMFLPAAVVLPWARRMPWAMAMAAIAGLLCLGAGFVLSTEMEWPLSHSAAAVGCVLAGASQLLRRVVTA
jgi:ABC-type Mn2+/Zn2+ transport system permease subunit